MKRTLLMLVAIILLVSCKKEDEKVAINMTTKVYKADAKYRSLPVYIMLSFRADGKVELYNFVEPDKKEVLSYEVGDRMATETTLRIYGTLSNGLLIDGFTAGTKIDWSTSIGRLAYKSEIVGFTAGGYHFN